VSVLEQQKVRILYRVIDARHCFGRVQLLVTPISGTGWKWVNADTVRKL